MTSLPITSTLLTDVRDGVVHVTLNRPTRKNALNKQMIEDLEGVFASIGADPTLRAVVLRGSSGTFCAGADVKDLLQVEPAEAEVVRANIAATNRRFGTLLEQIQASPLPLVVVLEGAVLGGGIGLACVSDVALTLGDASFGLPETMIGLVPAQIAPFVVQRIGLTHARRLTLTGARFDGHEAARLGLAHEVCAGPKALETALSRVLDQIRRCAPAANQATKQLLFRSIEGPLATVLDEAAERFAEAALGAEAGEGRAAFFEQRPPTWAK